jgi:osmotically-inducible protein OsmY
MAQRYEQNDNQGRESNRDTGQQWQERNREYNRQGYPSNAESSRYGAQNDYGSQGGDRSHGSDTYTSRGYGSQFEPGNNSRYPNQSFSQDGSQYGSGPYARENYGAGAGSEGRNASRQAFRDLYQEHGQSAGRADDRYTNQGRQPGDSAAYYGENLRGRGGSESGRESDYGAFGAQGYGGEGGFGAAGYGGQGGYARYGSQGEYGVPGGYGGDHGNRQGNFGARHSAIERQVERGSRTAFADQQVSYGEGVYGGYGQGGRGASTDQRGQSWGNWGRESNIAGRQQRRAPKGYQRSDERLREDICERLMNRWDIDAGEVSVEVKDGMVTLEGTVQNRRERHAIEDLIDDCHGVKDIDNKIRVQSGGQGRNQSWDEAIHRDSSSGTASNQPAQSGQSSTTGARLGADTSSSAPAISASTVAKKKDQSRE